MKRVELLGGNPMYYRIVSAMTKDKSLTYDEISHIHLSIYKIAGVLPFEGKKYGALGTHFSTIYFNFVNTVIITMNITGLTRKSLQGESNIEDVFENFFIQNTCLRFLMLNFQRKQLVKLTNYCQKLWQFVRDDEVEVVKGFETLVRYLIHYFWWMSVTMTTFYLISSKLNKLPPLTVNGTERRALPYRFYVDVQEQPWYEIISIVLYIFVIGFGLMLTVIESVGPFFIMMASGYLRSIQNRLISMTSNAYTQNNYIQNKKRCNKLKIDDVIECAKFHQSILEFCQLIEHFTRNMYIISVICTSYNVSLIGFKIIENEAETFKYVPVLLLSLLQLFTCQWIPQYLINESRGIADAAYSATLEHPEYKPEANQALLFMMLRAQKSVQLTAGGYMNLSLETFKRLFTSAISFFTLLRSMNI